MRRFAVIGSTVMLVACGSAPVAPDRGVAQASAPGSGAAYERRLEEAVALQEKQGRLADAAVSLELLAMLEPKKETTARLDALKVRIDGLAATRAQRGADAFKRGQFDLAMSHYLAVLALQPDNEPAANALRAIEKERNRRLLAARLRSKKPPVAPGSGD